MTPEQAKAKLQEWASGNSVLDPKAQKAAQQALQELYGGGGTAAPTNVDWQAIKDELDSNYMGGGVSAIKDVASAKEFLDKKLKSLKDLENANDLSSIGEKNLETVQGLLSKYFGGGGGQQPFDAMDIATTLSAAYGSDPEYFNLGGVKHKDMTPAQAKDALLYTLKNSPDAKIKQVAQGLYDKYFGSGNTVLDSPPPFQPPSFEPDTFSAEFKEIWPGSGWANEGHPLEESKTKLKNQVDNAVQQYPGTEKTNKGIALYQKWFGPYQGPPGSEPPPPPPPPMTPVQAYTKLIDKADNDAYATFKSPEFQKWFMAQPPSQLPSFIADPDLAATQYEEDTLPPPPPPKPFKSQELNPEDLTYWSANKPKSAAAWKNFSTWWGNTKLTPEQEQGLYTTWFPDKHPEKASDWFAQVFVHHSQPSEGDLGLTEGVPSWAHNSWAFGKKADQEWPIFQQWALKDPGLPKGTGMKQKLLIWNGLTPAEKTAIVDTYAPVSGGDTAGALTALKKAFPDSNWGMWEKMGPGTLKNNVETLAKTGLYPEAIKVYNQFFGGDIPLPKPEPKGKKPTLKVKPVIPSIPQSKLPQWVKDYGGQGSIFQGIMDSPSGAQKFTDFHRWADSIGLGKEAFGDAPDPEYPSKAYPMSLLKKWSAVPDHLKAQIAAMPTPPWKNEEQFNAWVAGQPTQKQEIFAITPEAEGNYYWYENPKSNKAAVEKLLTNETDPQKKQALLGLYQKYYGIGKSTLAEDLKKAAPGEADWDKYLKTTPPDTVAKLIKKKIKAETDPEKFVQLCDIWAKYFPGPPGHKQLSSVLGKNWQGGSTLHQTYLKQLYQWKKNGDPNAGLPGWNYPDADASPYLKGKELKGEENQTPWPKYFGWTPPGEVGGSDYVPDPAMLGTTGVPKSYAVPEISTSTEYQDLLATSKKWEPPSWNPSKFLEEYKKALPEAVKFIAEHPGLNGGVLGQSNPTPEQAKSELAAVLRNYPGLDFWQQQRLQNLWDQYFTTSGLSAHDKTTLGSEGFRQWFDGAPAPYRQVMKLHPGTALDEYQDFLQGGDLYPAVPEGPGKKVRYDLNPYRFLPYTTPGEPKTVHYSPDQKMKVDPHDAFESINPKPDMPPGNTKNPMRPSTERKNEVDWPEYPTDAYGQQELILPPGESMEPAHKPIELHRGIGFNLTDYSEPIPTHLKKSDPKQYYKELHKKLLMDMIRSTFLGSYGEKNVPDLFTNAKDTGEDKSAVVPVPEEWGSYAPEGVTGVFDFNKWAHDNHVPPEQLYSLAKKWKVDDPSKYGIAPLSEGPWTKGMLPEKSLESNAGFANLILDYLEATDYRGSQGYAPPGSLGDHWSLNRKISESFGKTGDFNVLVSADWPGQGEWANDPFAVVGFGSEQEIPLAPGAPVRVKRVRINSPDHGWKNWHDLVVHPHMRYASAPLPPRPQNTGTTPEQLYRLASSWGISHPERYGLPLRPPPPPPPAPVAVRRPGPAILTVAERYS